jgi:hypothetical protein
MADPFYTSPVFVVPVIWILFLSGILWATHRPKAGTHGSSDAH